MIGKLKEWFKLFRAPTLPVVLLPVMAGFLAGGGELFSLFGLAFFAWAWLTHHFTFAHNSLVDYVSGHDLKKSSATRPLVKRSISASTARRVVFPGLVLATGLGVALSMLAGGCASLSLASLALFHALGHAYNGLSKVAKWSFLPISAAFACLPLFSYFAVAGGDAPIAVMAVFVFLTMWFESDWEGGLKDIDLDERNILHDLGVNVSFGRLEVPLKAGIFAWVLKIVGLGAATYGILWHALTPWTALAWAVLGAPAVVMTAALTVDQDWNKRRMLAYTGVEEVFSFSLLLVLAAPVSGRLPVLAVIVFSVLWVPAVAGAAYGSLEEFEGW